MADNFDDRIARRISFITPLQVTDLTSGEIYQAKMLDYSVGGLSFASDGFFKKGSPLYFGILYPPDYTTSRVIEYYKGKVMWRKDSHQPSLSFEYGVQLAAESKLKDSSTSDEKPAKDLRDHPRRIFSRPLRFDAEKNVYDGSTKNISASGVFIATDQKMDIGRVITLNLPLKKGKMVRARGEIIWVNNEGFGLKFIKEK